MSGFRHMFVLFLLLPNSVSITLNNGGYEDIYIVIQDIIPENEELLNRIQDVFTKSSQLLFTATKNQVYFKKIKIVIPKSWTAKDHYNQLPALSVLNTFITIDKSYYVKAPHVRSRTNTCGAEGWYMFLTPEFLLETGVTDWGKHENVIVHEWGHLRWGLFDEYADPNGRMGKFYMKGGEWKPVGCSSTLQGTVGWGTTCDTRYGRILCDTKDSRKTMRSECDFCPQQDQSVNISIMGYQYIDALTMFCDKNDASVSEDQRHNDKAPNQQNLFCNSRSAWEVMREHEDFKSNPDTLPSNFDTTPEFEFIQETDGYRVLVLDVSGSMSSYDRIGTLHQSAEYIIQEVIPFGSWLAIVMFSTYATKLIDLTRVNSQADRDILKQALPTSTYSYTCIGCGIEEALQILNDKLGYAENGEIILITDGGNNVGDLITSRANAVTAKVVIHTVAVSQLADTTLSDIAAETGGKHFTYLETGTVSFAAVLSATISPGLTSAATQYVTLISEKNDSSSSNVFDATFALEDDLGSNTSITVLATYSGKLQLQLLGPNNYQQKMTANGSSATMKIPDVAQAGTYHFTITLEKSQTVEFYVTSYPSVSDNNVIRVFSRLNTSNVDYSADELPVVFVDVSKSYAPVLNATVHAIVDATNCTLDLNDNGMDPDRLKNDGTYSGYIWRSCLSSGRLNIKVKADGNEGETMLQYGLSGSVSPYTDGNETEVIGSSFQRVVVTEELFISNYNDNTTDVTAPGRITDLEINNIQTENTEFGESRNFTITWTATGDDKSNGQASEYEMKISNDSLILRDNFDTAEFFNITNGILVPQVAGQLEALKLAVDAEGSYTEDMFFALRAIDDNGNIGPVSNIVPIAVARGFRISGEQGYAVFEDEIIITDEISPSNDKEDKKSTLIISLTVAGATFLIIGVLIIFLKKHAVSKAVVADSETPRIVDAGSRTLIEPLHQNLNRVNFASTKMPSAFVPTPAFVRVINEPQSLTSAKMQEPRTSTYSDCTENVTKVTEEAVVNIEDYIDEFEDPDTYITVKLDPPSLLPTLPFNKTNKAKTIHSVFELADEETFDDDDSDDNATVMVLSKDEKEKVLEQFPELPFENHEHFDRSHPPPNMALHVLKPEDYGPGKKPYAFPSPFSGVTLSLPGKSNEDDHDNDDGNDDDVADVDNDSQDDDDVDDDDDYGDDAVDDNDNNETSTPIKTGNIADEGDAEKSDSAEDLSFYDDNKLSVTSAADIEHNNMETTGSLNAELQISSFVASSNKVESTSSFNNELRQQGNTYLDSGIGREIDSEKESY